MGVAPAALVEGVARTPLSYGLFSAVGPFRAGDRERWESGVQWEPLTCDGVDGIGAPVPSGGVQAVQRVTISGTPTAGWFILRYGSTRATDSIAYNATAATVQAALSAIGVATIVTGGPGPGTPYTITFSQPGPRPTLASTASLTGGTAPTIAISVITPGVASLPVSQGLPKNLDGNRAAIGEASAFTVYGHDVCSPIGGNGIAQAQGRATAHLVAREEARVERALWTGDLGNVPNLAGTGTAPDPTTLAGGTAVPPDVAFALLEDYISGNYGSLGVIHVTRGTAVQAAARRVVEIKGVHLQTSIGTPVAAGAGYPGTSPAGASAGAGQAWAYASPAIFGYRSEVFTSSNRPGDLLDRSHNDLYAVAERTYLLGFDPCGVAAVLMDLSLA